MRKTPNLDVERYRVREGEYASLRADGNNGLFVIPAPINNTGQPLLLLCVVSDGAGWEHVSVSVKVRLFNGRLREAERTPTWEEMCHVKDLFWDRDECVIQYHPRATEYRNYHKYVLHLWRPTDQPVPEPNADFVAPRVGESVEDAVARFEESA